MTQQRQYSTIGSLHEAMDLLKSGYNLVSNRQKKLFIRNKSDLHYVPKPIRAELLKLVPSYNENSTVPCVVVIPDTNTNSNANLNVNSMIDITEPALPETIQPVKPTIPTFPIPPDEYILSNIAAHALETVAILENLHASDDARKHELAFAHTKGENKFSEKSAGQTLLSLLDVTVYFLAECDRNFQTLHNEIRLLEFEKIMIQNANYRLENRLKIYEKRSIVQTLIL